MTTSEIKIGARVGSPTFKATIVGVSMMEDTELNDGNTLMLVLLLDKVSRGYIGEGRELYTRHVVACPDYVWRIDTD